MLDGSWQAPSSGCRIIHGCREKKRVHSTAANSALLLKNAQIGSPYSAPSRQVRLFSSPSRPEKCANSLFCPRTRGLTRVVD